MLIEIWERLRGYDKWIETEARVRSSNVERTSRKVKGGRQDVWIVTNSILWTPRQGQIQCADFNLADISLPKHFDVGEAVTIRYNPEEPSIYYLRELFLLNLRRRIKWTALLLAWLGAWIGIVVLLGRFH